MALRQSGTRRFRISEYDIVIFVLTKHIDRVLILITVSLSLLGALASLLLSLLLDLLVRSCLISLLLVRDLLQSVELFSI